jgi:Tol biopolymer transport system component
VSEHRRNGMTQRDWAPSGHDGVEARALRGSGRFVAPAAALVGLVLIGWLTFVFLTGDVRLPGGTGTGGIAGNPTPAPSNVVIVDPRSNVAGDIIYVKAGNVWIQSGREARQLTTSGIASMPSWAPDGKSIVYVETRSERGLAPFGSTGRAYRMSVPTLTRIAADGSGQPQPLATGRVQRGRYTWSYWIRDPVLSPDGRIVAMISDGTDPTTTDVVVQLLDLQTRRVTKPKLAENSPLGHQDPAWRPDGKLLLYVKNARDGARGTPTINTYDPLTGRSSALTGPGYLSPSWSRDGRFVAATRTDSFGTNIVILDAATGTELVRLTSDGQSWSPVWSPKGDAIAYLHLENEIVDLRMIPLTGQAPNWTPGAPLNLTEVSGLDGASRPGWFIPPDQLPPLPTAGSPAPSGASSGGVGSESPSAASTGP